MLEPIVRATTFGHILMCIIQLRVLLPSLVYDTSIQLQLVYGLIKLYSWENNTLEVARRVVGQPPVQEGRPLEVGLTQRHCHLAPVVAHPPCHEQRIGRQTMEH
jgi:hypothetical protein